MWFYSVAIQPLRELAAYYRGGDPSCNHLVTKTHNHSTRKNSQAHQKRTLDLILFKEVQGRKGINSGFKLFQGVLKGSDTERNNFWKKVNCTEAHAELYPRTRN